MQEKQKMIVCYNYDSILNKCPKIREMGNTSLINTNSPIINSPFSQRHMDILYAFANKSANDLQFNISINEIIEYMYKPDFDVNTHFPMALLKGNDFGIQQSLVIGETEEQVTIEKKQKIKALRKVCKSPLIPVTHVVKTKLADNLYYFVEEMIILSESQFNALVYSVANQISIKRCISIDKVQDGTEFKMALWNVLEQRHDTKYNAVPNGFYSSIGEYMVEFDKCHDVPLRVSGWVNPKYTYYDNRSCYPETTKEVPLIKQLKIF